MKKIRIPDIFFNISFFLLTGFFLLFIFSCTGFILNIGINSFYTPLSLISAAFALFFLFPNVKTNLLSIFISFLFIIISLFISNHLFDSSYDGPWYHQTAALFLKEGWNPVYVRAADFLAKHWDFKILGVPYIDSYPKFSEIVAANIFYLTGNIESGKSFNFLFSIILFFYSMYILTEFFKENDFLLSLFLSLLLVLNPVCLAQIYTYDVDGLVYNSFMLLLLSIIELEKTDHNSKKARLILIMSTLILMSTKSTGIFYAFETYALWMIYLKIKKQDLKVFFKNIFILAFLFILTGINPYLTNLYQGKHLFYPLMGQDKIDFMATNTPRMFLNKSMPYKLFISTFNHVDDDFKEDFFKGKRIQLKLPFTYDDYELSKLPYADIRICGFGVWWSGILLLSVLLFPFVWSASAPDKALNRLILLVLLTTVLTNPVNWWARYVPQFYAFPVFVLLFLSQRKNIGWHICIYGMLSLIYINSFITHQAVLKNTFNFTKKQQMSSLKNDKSTIVPEMFLVPEQNRTAEILMQAKKKTD
ncbi:MAG: hypothetical protein IKR09_05965 [Alphaproteobacteria bacterium]|nr:hypothetical protein [Alphaproteobacteria bacterium]